MSEEPYYSKDELLSWAEKIAEQEGPEPMVHPGLLRQIVRLQFKLLNPGWVGKK